MDKLREIEKLVRKHPDNKLSDQILAIINPKTVEELVDTLSNYAAGKAEESARSAKQSELDVIEIIMNRANKLHWDALENMWTDPTEKVAPPEKIFTHKVDINGQVFAIPIYPNKDVDVDVDDEDLN